MITRLSGGSRPPAPLRLAPAAGGEPPVASTVRLWAGRRKGEQLALIELGSPTRGVLARAELTPLELAQLGADIRTALTMIAAHDAGENVVPIGGRG